MEGTQPNGSHRYSKKKGRGEAEGENAVKHMSTHIR